jgi:hypothetical protein
MLLVSFRSKDRMHLRDMIEVGLVDETWLKVFLDSIEISLIGTECLDAFLWSEISNSRSLNRDSSYLAHFDIKTVSRHPSRGKEGMKCGRVAVG